MKINFTIDRFEGDKAVLKNETDTVLWPKKNLPASIHEGTVLTIDIMPDDQQESKNKKIAKDILNEILGN